MKNYSLVIVSARSIVIRPLSETSYAEIKGCLPMMRQTLILEGNNVIFEHRRGEKSAEARCSATDIKKQVERGEVLRTLTEKEIVAIERTLKWYGKN